MRTRCQEDDEDDDDEGEDEDEEDEDFDEEGEPEEGENGVERKSRALSCTSPSSPRATLVTLLLNAC